MSTITTYYNDEVVKIEFDYDPGEPMVWTYPNGDPGHPGEPPSCEIHHVWWDTIDSKGNKVSIDIFPLLDEDDLIKIEEEICD
jgi:hypothetical protein